MKNICELMRLEERTRLEVYPLSGHQWFAHILRYYGPHDDETAYELCEQTGKRPEDALERLDAEAELILAEEWS